MIPLLAEVSEMYRVVAIVLVSCAITVTVVIGRMVKNRGGTSGPGASGILTMALVMALGIGAIIGVIAWLKST